MVWRATVAAGIAGLLIWLVGESTASAQEQANDGEQIFSSRCAMCHGVDRSLIRMRQRNPVEVQSYLDTFLLNHFPPPSTDRAKVIRYLVDQLEK